jgi:hypothetical protein
MLNLAGRFKFIFILIISVTPSAWGETQFTTWDDYYKELEHIREQDRKNGISYIISGSLALASGILADTSTSDPIEKGVYTLFQTIGVASIGYGSYQWQIGGEDRLIYNSLQLSKIPNDQKMQFLKSYRMIKAEQLRRERIIRAITHGMISALNFYNASAQKNDSVKTSLNFIGGVNLLAALSYTFEF